MDSLHPNTPNRHRAFLFAAVLCVALLLVMPASAGDFSGSEPMVRVGLYYADLTGDCSRPTLHFASESGFIVGEWSESGQFVQRDAFADNQMTAVAEAGSSVVLTGADGAALYTGQPGVPVCIVPLAQDTVLSVEGTSYEGTLELVCNAKGTLNLINALPMETYVKGVLPCELYATWPEETLKTGAVIVRSFALSSIGGKHQSGNFDVCGTTHCQVYQGSARRTERTDAAVDATFGVAAVFRERIALTPYHSSNGGATESAAACWGSAPEDYPYLASVETPFEDYHSYPYAVWQSDVAEDELVSYLNEQNAQTPLCDIAAIDYTVGPSGYVYEMTFTDSAGNQIHATRSQNVRSMVSKYVNSACFSIAKTFSMSNQDHEDTLSILTANGVDTAAQPDGGFYAVTADGTVRFTGTSGRIVIDGKGFGHGVGLSQYGAMTLGELGYRYEDILGTYYPGIELRCLYGPQSLPEPAMPNGEE